MLKIGIVGLPNVGKSTLFKALTKKTVDIANYPFCTIEPNMGVVEVPDERLKKLAELSHSKKAVPAVVEFVDIAGLVKGAAEGEGLGNKFLTHIREVDAIAEVVRVFEDKNVIHVHEKPEPVSDIQVIEYELILKDLETVKKKRETAEKDAKGNKKGAEEEARILKELEGGLEKGETIGKILSTIPASFVQDEARHLADELQLLTAKPFVYVLNVSEQQIAEHWKPDEALVKNFDGMSYVVISAKIEAELADLADEEKTEFLRSLGLNESGLDQLIRVGYETLGLMTFFTTGEDETRAWTIPNGSTAPRAGRAIHSDFEERFIRADIIHWQKLIAAQELGEPRPDGREADAWARAREHGWVRTEGKEYVVKDGDVIEFKI